ncbi:bifunctional UDP-N-acetylglucosamine transferase and deubiquitinase ALG13 isoform X4 [Pelobates cultripes]|uniref:UDP-N-acetylglucosamine transferase subunit ALG13 n=1 Tax=Pelobates cultripes TaxID=61616 RepID=A0AAD1SZG8_PELCU|nr:bifunctional UDP-N-acetylglucosamine transferase and deubiquitinase ALG13 isoform X4 [Pelobates cultripes]
MAKCVFVTVGTTSFDQLIDCVTAEENITILKGLGYSRLDLQIGRGTVNPKPYSTNKFTVDVFRYKRSLAEDLKKADLVISHAGAGSCLEALGEGKPLIAVVNENLMDNHQTELAKQLYKDGHLYYCTCSTLGDTLLTMDLSALKPYEPGHPEIFASFLDEVIGYK